MVSLTIPSISVASKSISSKHRWNELIADHWSRFRSLSSVCDRLLWEWRGLILNSFIGYHLLCVSDVSAVSAVSAMQMRGQDFYWICSESPKWVTIAEHKCHAVVSDKLISVDVRLHRIGERVHWSEAEHTIEEESLFVSIISVLRHQNRIDCR